MFYTMSRYEPVHGSNNRLEMYCPLFRIICKPVKEAKHVQYFIAFAIRIKRQVYNIQAASLVQQFDNV